MVIYILQGSEFTSKSQITGEQGVIMS